MSGTCAGNKLYCFGEFSLDLARGEFRRGAACVTLRPKPFKVLVHLVENAGRLVTKDELLETAWGRVIVSDGALSQCIVDIRKALGSDSRQLLRTVPRRGFILDAAVRVHLVSTEATVDGEAVLPPQHSVSERGPAFRLARRVALTGVAAMLGLVAFVLAPGLGDRTGSSPAAETGSSAAVAAGAMGQAGEYFVLGRFLFHRRATGDLAAAEQHLDAALALAPQHAEAWTLLAGVYAAQDEEAVDDPTERLSRQRRALERALAIDPDSAEAHVRLARYFRRSGQIAEFHEALARALHLDSNEPLVLFTRAGVAMLDGGPEQAIPLMRQALEQQPLSTVYRSNLASTLLAAGRHEEALRQFRRVAEINPAVDNLYYDLCLALLLAGRPDEARTLSRRVEEGASMDQLRVLLDTGDVKSRAAARLSADTSASGLLRRAEVAAFEGDTDGAFALLEQAISTGLREGSSSMRPARVDDVILQAAWSPFLHGLRDDPRWGMLIAQARKDELA